MKRGMKNGWILLGVGLLAGILVFCGVRFGVAADDATLTQGPLTYTVVEGGTVTIKACDKAVTGAVEIPNEIDGLPVTEISASAFANCTGLTSITIPENVTEIGDKAFYSCLYLTEVNFNARNCANKSSSSQTFYNAGKNSTGITVTIGENVERLPNYLFHYQSTTFYYDAKIISIHFNAINCANLPWNADVFGNNFSTKASTEVSELVIGEHVRHIPSYLCYQMKRITNIDIPESVETIGSYAFSGCVGITQFRTNMRTCNNIDPFAASYGNDNIHQDGVNVVIGKDVTVIPKQFFVTLKTDVLSFSVENDNPFFCSENGILFSKTKDELVLFPSKSSIMNYVIPQSVKTIAYRAFSCCKNLTSVTISENVLTVEERAFNDCSYLTEIVFNARNCQNFNYNAQVFYNAGRQESGITLTIGENVERLPSYLFNCSIASNSSAGCDAKIKVIIFNATDFSGSASRIFGSGSLSAIEEVRFGSEVKHIPADFCKNMAKISMIEIPESVETIGKSAFENCFGVTDFRFNARNCNDIDPFSFSNTPTTVIPSGYKDNIQVTIGKEVTVIPNRLFYTLKSFVKDFLVEEDNNYYCSENGIVFSKTKDEIILFPCKSEIQVYEIPESITTISYHAFANCMILTSITIPENVTKINNEAFFNCLNFTNIVFNARSCEELASNSMATFNAGINGSGITLTIGENVERIPKYLFFYNGTSFNDDAKIVTLRFNATNCLSAPKFSNVQEIIFGENVRNIPASLCESNKIITEIRIPKNVESIGRYAFSNCTKVSTVYFNAKNCSNTDPFYDSRFTDYFEGDVRVVIGKDVATIPTKFFATLKKSVNSFSSEEESINYCTENGILFSKSKDEIILFPCKSDIRNYIIPDSVTKISSQAFADCVGLKSVTISKNVAIIEESAFYNCTYLTEVIFNARNCANVNSNSNTFYDAGKSENGITVIIGETVERLPDFLFFSTYYSHNHSAKIKKVIFNAINCADLKIESYVFGYNWEVGFEQIQFGNNVQNIPANLCRGMKKITSIIIPANITRIGDYAFCNCIGIEHADILNPYVSVGNNAFYEVMDVQFDGDDPKAPWGAKALNAFIDADGLAYADSSRRMLVGCPADREGTVELPATVEAVDDLAFAGCNLLTRIVFLQTNTPLLLSPNMFGEDQPPENLLEIVSPNTDDYGVTYTSEERTSILFCNRLSEGDVPVAASVRALCDFAFANCENVRVTFEQAPEFEIIGKDALFGTVNYQEWQRSSAAAFSITSGDYTYILDAKENLSSFNIPAGTRCIAAEAFNRCSNLATVNLLSSDLKSIGRRAFRSCTFNAMNIGEAVRTALKLNYLGADVFNTEAYCSNAGNTRGGLTYFCGCLVRAAADSTGQIEASTTLIADGAFRDCLFTSIDVPEGVTRIGREAFAGCVNLTAISLPSTLKSIGDYAFRDCSALTEISLPSGLSSLGMYAFFNCSSLEAIHADGTYYCDLDGVLFRLDGNDSASLIQYPPAKTETDLQYAVPATVLGSKVTYLESFCFRRCQNLNNISHGSDIRYGYKNPFEGCKHVNDQSSVYDPEDSTILAHVSVDWTGENGDGVYRVADNVTEIGANAFSGCVGIRKVVLGSKVATIREEAFLNCTALETVVWNSALNEIGNRAFMNCSALTAASFPLRLETIGVSAFENCTSLKTVSFLPSQGAQVNTNMEYIGSRAFCNCAPDLTVQTIKSLPVGDEAFAQSINEFFTDCVIEPLAFHVHGFHESFRKAATCESYGRVEYACACGDQKVENLPALGHSFGEWHAVKVENGVRTERRTCANCTESEERELSLGATFVTLPELIGTPQEFVTSIFTFFFKLFFEAFRIAFRR